MEVAQVVAALIDGGRVGSSSEHGARVAESLAASAAFTQFVSMPSAGIVQVDVDAGGRVVEVAVEAHPPVSGTAKVVVVSKAEAVVVTASNASEVLRCSTFGAALLPAVYAHVSEVVLPLLAKATESGALSLPAHLKVGKLLAQLQKRLGVALRVAGLESEDGLAGGGDAPLEASILNPADELKTWKRAASSGGASSDGGRVWAAFARVAGDVARFDAASLGEQMDILDVLQEVLDEVWCLDLATPFPQERMAHFMEVVSHAVGRAAGAAIGAAPEPAEPRGMPRLFKMHPSKARAQLAGAARLVSSWSVATQRLTGVLWRGAAHPWRGSAFSSEYLAAVHARLSELSSMLASVAQLLELAPADEAAAAGVADRGALFAPFAGIYLLELNVANPSATAFAEAAKVFASRVVPLEGAVAAALEASLSKLAASPAQLLHAVERNLDALLRPTVFGALATFRGVVASALLELSAELEGELSGLKASPRSASKLTGLDLPASVESIVEAKGIEARAEHLRSIGSAVCGREEGGARAVGALKAVSAGAAEFVHGAHGGWVRDVLHGVESAELVLELTGKVLGLSASDGSMVVSFSPRLVALLREVRVLSGLGLPVPQSVTSAFEVGTKYYRYGMVLRQVAAFYNSLGSEIIFSQMPMMMDASREFEALVSSASDKLSWEAEAELSEYVDRVQASANKLMDLNRRLRSVHFELVAVVLRLMGTSLLTEREAWREGVAQINGAIAALQAEGFTGMDGWVAHWNQQLYKALEYQYREGLETLNAQLPPIKVALVYKQGALAFEPAFEELRLQYYAALKKFVSIPHKFKGVGVRGSNIFSSILAKNGQALERVYILAEALFGKLEAAKAPFEEWVALGRVDVRKWIAATFSELADWERNFRALKSRGKAFEKALPDSIEVECMVVSTIPVKAAIDGFMRSFADALVTTLKQSSSHELQLLRGYMDEGKAVLSTRPQSVQEIGEAKGALAALVKRKREMLKVRGELSAKSKLLRNVVGGGIELGEFDAAWEQFEIGLDAHGMLIESQTAALKNNLQSRQEELNAEAAKLASHWTEAQPSAVTLADPAAAEAAATVVAEYKGELGELVARGASLRADCEHFALPPPDLEPLDSLAAEIEGVTGVWDVFSAWSAELSELASVEWYTFRARLYVFEEFVAKWRAKLLGTGGEASKDGGSGGGDDDGSDDGFGAGMGADDEAETGGPQLDGNSPIVKHLQSAVRLYSRVYSVLKYCRGDSFTAEHWAALFRIVGLPRGLKGSQLTFGHFLGVMEKIEAGASELKALHDRAEAEVTVRQALAEMDAWGAEAVFSLLPPSETRGVALITEWKDLLTEVGDKQSLLQSLKDSRLYSVFANQIDGWERKLGALDSALTQLNLIQRKWVYLEPIFSKGALPSEAARFKRIDDDFVSVLAAVAADPRVVSLLAYPGLEEMLPMTLDQLERSQRALAAFLEAKRSAFPRFYFIGDDDLLEILGQSTKPEVIQSHLKKLFAGVASVTFDGSKTSIVSINSSKGERVALQPPLTLTPQVEEWLSRLVKAMRSALASQLDELLRTGAWDDENGLSVAALNGYPSQLLSLAENIGFAASVEKVLSGRGEGIEGGLETVLRVCLGKLKAYTGIHSQLDASAASKLLSAKIKNLVLELVHNADVTSMLLAARQGGGLRLGASSWEWSKQLRFVYDGLGRVRGVMGDAAFEYTFEYQGNVSKLVHTALTDKCYLTLTQGMALGYGGNPYGPAGTGKTESIKALGASLGRQVLVFNCDEGIDFKSMGRIFTGLVKCGAWGCFDEFNRLDEVVLSAVSQQIQTIQSGIKARASSISLLGKTVELDANSGIFVTMNPAGKGYGGRSKLPDNLKQLFRPVAMSKPDLELIAEVILYAEGFSGAKGLAKKLVSMYGLNAQLLSKQQHYDWGLRALKAVLSLGGSLLGRERNARRAAGASAELSGEEETALLVKALRSNTLSKLTYADSVLFEGLVGDLFPGVTTEAISYAELESALAEELSERRLVVVERQMTKLLQLYEATNQRMGVVIVGPSGSGKSTLWQVLAGALNRLGGRGSVVTQVMNPKALPRQQLLGSLDLDTREWADGVLTAAAREVVARPARVRSWIVCDGDVDPKWIESLNSVLDDNRLLTMPNGERIQFGSNVNFVFETHDLSYASPATISRMGMIFLSEAELSAETLVAGWASRSEASSSARAWMGELGSLLEGAELGVLRTLFALLEQAGAGSELSKEAFAVAAVRALAGAAASGAKASTAKAVLAALGVRGVASREAGAVYYDERSRNVRSYGYVAPSLSVDDVSRGVLVETVGVQSVLGAVVPLLEAGMPVVVEGPPGAGKELVLRAAFARLGGGRVASVHCSSQTRASDVIRKLYESCIAVNSNKGRVLRPKGGRLLTVYLKNLNMATPDEYETSELGALLHQLLTYGGFYSSELEWVALEGVVFAGSMNPATTLGRYALSPRLSSLVATIRIDYGSSDELSAVAEAYVEPVLGALGGGAGAGRASALAAALVQVYNQVRAKFTVDEARHYLFTPRELLGWVSSLLRYSVGSDEGFEGVLDVVVAEARARFGERLVDERACARFDAILGSVFRASFNYAPAERGRSVYTSWSPTADGEGKLGLMALEGFAKVVQGGIKVFERDWQELKLKIFPQMLALAASYDRVLSAKDGSGHVLAVGAPGTGKSSLLKVVAHMHSYEIAVMSVSRPPSIKEFRNWLKGVLLKGGVEGTGVLVVVRDSQVFSAEVLEALNALLGCGEVPGLFTPEELDGLLAPLRPVVAEIGWYGSVGELFVSRVRANVHVALVMDPSAEAFGAQTESNPALFASAQVVWSAAWTKDSLKRLPRVLLKKVVGKMEDRDEVLKLLRGVHSSAPGKPPPRKFTLLLHTYAKVLAKKRKAQESQTGHLRAGLSKLAEAAKVVDELGAEAAEQEVLLAEKEAKADAALSAITKAVEDASSQRAEMERLEERLAVEEEQLTREKAKIDAETAQVQPMLESAAAAVGSLDRKSLTEARTMPNPPTAVRDVLTVVLQMMGSEDTSWNAMRAFLGRKGLVEEVLSFSQAGGLVDKYANSFEASTITRASRTIAPLAAWVLAQLEYARVVKQIRPLMDAQASLEASLDKSARRVARLQGELEELDARVAKLKKEFKKRTRDAEKLQNSLEGVQVKKASADKLLSQLGGERERWERQLGEYTEAEAAMPREAVLAAGFLVYLGGQAEGERARVLQTWSELARLPRGWRVESFLASEAELLRWKAAGLPSDSLSVENAVVILESEAPRVVIDPGGAAVAWLKSWLSEGGGGGEKKRGGDDGKSDDDDDDGSDDGQSGGSRSGRVVEVIASSDPRLNTKLELGVRFGKTVVLENVDSIDEMLLPLLRRDLRLQGTRSVVQLGEKVVDYNPEFELFVTSRDAHLRVHPDVAALVTEVNFSVTASGLESQLLGYTLRHEQPQLEEQKSALLREEEEQKVELAELEKSLLETLATSSGDLLENQELVASLNETKRKSKVIADALAQSRANQAVLDEQREAYVPIARTGSQLYFLVAGLEKLNAMYAFSLGSFVELFHEALGAEVSGGAGAGIDGRLLRLQSTLLRLVHKYVSASLFKEDRLGFELHLVHGLRPELFLEGEWELLVSGGTGMGGSGSGPVPSWVPAKRASHFAALRARVPSLVSAAELSESAMWSPWNATTEAEARWPEVVARAGLSWVQKLLLLLVFRPDRLLTGMRAFVDSVLSLGSSDVELRSVAERVGGLRPALLVATAGADPSVELEALAGEVVGARRYFQLAMGQGQGEAALQLVRECAKSGGWVTLKNLHLVLPWVAELNKELSGLASGEVHREFKLWLTTEAHAGFPASLAARCVKMTVEAPPGLKRNLARSVEAVLGAGEEGGSCGQARFALAVFHSLVQERRSYMPQGWSKFYEFSEADLRVGASVVTAEVSGKGPGEVQWDKVVGLFENAIYGGRVDNEFDMRVLVTYLGKMFNGGVISGRGGGELVPGMRMPASGSLAEAREAVARLPEADEPGVFGLPANISRAVEQARSAEVIAQLKALGTSQGSSSGFDRVRWAKGLEAVLQQWAGATSSSGVLDLVAGGGSGSSGRSPVAAFLELEFVQAMELVELVDGVLGEVVEVLEERRLVSPAIVELVEGSLLSGSVPEPWFARWEGPLELGAWLGEVVRRTVAVSEWRSRARASLETLLQDELVLSELFRPGTFLNAVRQESARKLGVAMDSLALVSSVRQQQWVGTIRVGGLLLQGGSYSGGRGVRLADATTPSFAALGSLYMAWVPEAEAAEWRARIAGVPLYEDGSRDKMVVEVGVEVEGGEVSEFVLAGLAVFLRE
ncbi:cytoplasmic dynein 2 heavy chain 1 [Thecamonas trahens ATCC 50062]|uniref:Cytoplasmic dynein 2 heavy chain 1 n=1 Tax=Thecamonas trahens ATCC 50062 TaxID=461836 RepID=A0A0L0D997_THETB|nr:cytoplasmic dynein 2 heavy chain 1 [Thecamonas trahens ATCC 50062]KNC47878.1 cytoplasmic dynein 2 heavy chain 1 [Thecamonas trahens ATCC 50062]|eukprot:XP_013759356.1 cytoplasmic dynein 2 heavy chain 1 [Thecamonas trahens ATCC 50062]